MKKILFTFMFYSLISFGLTVSSKESQKAWLGISVKPTNNGDIKLLINKVEENSPAKKSGLKIMIY